MTITSVWKYLYCAPGQNVNICPVFLWQYMYLIFPFLKASSVLVNLLPFWRFLCWSTQSSHIFTTCHCNPDIANTDSNILPQNILP